MVSGNVSFYNQSARGRSIPPSPIVACFGVLENYAHAITPALKEEGNVLVLVGRRRRELGGSAYWRSQGIEGGSPPRIVFADVRAEIRTLLQAVERGLVRAAHDISEGGLATAAAEMALAGGRGIKLELEARPQGLRPDEFLFSETGGFLIETDEKHLEALLALCREHGVDAEPVGSVRGNRRLEIDVRRRLGDEPRSGATRTAPRRGAGGSAAMSARRFDQPWPRVAVLQLPGVNCEYETRAVLARAELDAEIFRWNRPAKDLEEFDAYVIPGGFSYEDRIRAGAVAAKVKALDVVVAAAEAGKPVLGICNGAQVLVEAGLVPGVRPGFVETALAENAAGWKGYYCAWVHVRVVKEGRETAFTSRFEDGEIVPMPVAHAQGRFTVRDRDRFAEWMEKGQVPLRYVTPDGDDDPVLPVQSQRLALRRGGDDQPRRQRARLHAASGTGGTVAQRAGHACRPVGGAPPRRGAPA